jgi:hypothetical protein
MKTDNIYFPCKFVLLLHPIGRLSLFMSKFMMLGQKYSIMIPSKMVSSSLDNIWPEPAVRICILDQWEETIHRGIGINIRPVGTRAHSLQ